MLEEALNVFAKLMAENLAMPFPFGFRGPLTEQHRSRLTRLTSIFEQVLPAIDDEYATKYYALVRDMAVLAVEIEGLRFRREAHRDSVAPAP
ncbi:hypothetical protein GCM10009850_072220 [Nonomuraea monospora]|uniref:Uncharacterized protein n=1 Tax=Nonomuraea monospora TaxID=568818 RepID=A0ABP5PJJ3_9ACTN